jgi:hypothetical protein
MGAAAERRIPVAMHHELRLGRVGDVEDGKPAIAPRAVEQVAGDEA